MPGVPSYRGCEACRKQKKKCDQAKPACSRCARLEIPCVGCGQQRYKFKDETSNLKAADSHLVRRSASALSKSNNTARAAAPSRPLTNTVSLATGAFVSVLEITDPRYDLFCYGPFIRDIPLQLGRHTALDASADALASAFRSVHTGRVSLETLSKNVRALNSVQRSLQDPATAYSEQTLCAIYLIMLCQGWIGTDEISYPKHGEAMAHLLSVIVSRNWREGFDSAMLVTLSMTVLIESVFNPAIQLEPWLSTLAEAHKPTYPVHSLDGVSVTSLDLHNLSQMTDILRRPSQNIAAMKALYHLIRLETPGLRKHLLEIIEPACAGPSDKLPIVLVRLQTCYHAAYCLILAMGITFNGMLRALDPHDALLVEERDIFCKEILAHAERLKRRRPFGASHIPLGLVAAWAAVDDPTQQAAITNMFIEYETALTTFSWLSKADLLKEGYDRVCRNLSASPDAVERGETSDDPRSGIEVNCGVEFRQNEGCSIL
ncbi:Uncharacterized protein TPAR_04700 [Tolypocladium paradoxum]|uniref:Zn(2)-C6 fungal-type domain-containing protein n=1 Tax=Tolypocladium paradoxum TaxID=94208 RepID=A0A2S4KY13_9HYPO|nr:Uncharacterized protein TPAR_04700 [Tolypocladium paradoxum]